MHAIALLGAAAALFGPATAMPKATPEPHQAAALDLARRANIAPRADPTAPWVTVGDEGKPVKTITPSMTTISGTPTLVSVAPHDITASVYTWTTWGSITTSTGRPPNPTATSKDGEGLRLPLKHAAQPAELRAKGHKTNNVTITLQVAPRGSKDSNSSLPLHVALQDPALPSNPAPQVPKGRTLSIALPVALGGVVFIVVGVFLWNRSARRIHLGSIMGRSRHGYSGRKARRGNMFRGQKDAASIQLHNADDHLSDGEYHDAPISGRRDSEALGSLAGTPVNESFDGQGTWGGARNAFRDELDRQHQERRGF
ncbi:hypothetical protein M440DRAFT_1404519 [Trichoderma longibrachiatum ATCC 18648]|uniref:Mid2 domain-containing protein n=1 Tax=Trichoderma longibrachiatum ATCC 18648 TaxID=983965 RepID=A0A2T4BW52_TRILO|nr:hypothetical protein M440DRAFT_1404519 [Trichoderma longibrachiatum ATCC 18648]